MKGLKIKDLMITIRPQTATTADCEVINHCPTPSRPDCNTSQCATPTRPDCYTSQCATPTRPDCHTSQCQTPSRPGHYMGPDNTAHGKLQPDFTNSDELIELKKLIAGMQKKMEPALQDA